VDRFISKKKTETVMGACTHTRLISTMSEEWEGKKGRRKSKYKRGNSKDYIAGKSERAREAREKRTLKIESIRGRKWGPGV